MFTEKGAVDMDQEIRKKEYVQVTAIFTRDGKIIPQEIKLEDGRRFEIDRITDIRRAPSLKAGGMGIRYTCRIYGKSCYLFYEENYMWFVEMKTA